jgi:RNA polymerase sigma-70 factor (ECF subfamily)
MPVLHWHHEARTVTPLPAAPSGDDAARELIERIQAGDDPKGDFELFECLFRRYRSKVYSYFMHQTHNAMDSEDLTQETFMRVYEHIGSLRESSRFEAWLKTTMTHVYCDQGRHSQTDKRSGHTEPLQALGAELDSHPALTSRQRNPLDEMLMHERRQELIKIFPTTMGKCVVFRYYHGLSYKDIAKLMNIKVGTVSAHLAQARKCLALRGGVPQPSTDVP